MATLSVPSPEMTAARPVWPTWRVLLTIGLVALGVWATFAAWRDLMGIAYHDEESSHIFLVPFVVGWLIWERRDLVHRYRPGSSLLGPALIALGGLSSWYGFYHATQALWHLGAVLVLVGSVVTVLGHRLVWRLWPVFLVLLFLIPVPGEIRARIAIPLQRVTAGASAFAFELLGAGVARTGSLLTFRGVDVNVAEACNGMRMVFALGLVAFTFVFTTPLRPSVRLIILLLSPLIAVVCNVIRLVPTVFAYGYLPHAQAELFHDVSGWIMLGVAFVVLMGIVGVLRWAQIPVMQADVAGGERGPGAEGIRGQGDGDGDDSAALSDDQEKQHKAQATASRHSSTPGTPGSSAPSTAPEGGSA